MALDGYNELRISRQAMKAELLDAETEIALARAWAQNRDAAALHRLITAYMRLAVSMALKFRRYGAPLNDLIQEANLGLMKAAEKFDPERGVRFSTYAVWWIKAGIQDHVMRNWSLVFCGNFAGALTVAVFMAIIFTFGWSEAPNAIGQKIGHIGEGRTVGYAAHGAAGMLTLFIRGVMCNWMVSTGVVAAMMSTSVSGKAIGMWMPITVFFYMGFEHSVVNMFLFPSGLLLGGNFTFMDYLIWNEIPTVLGNLVGGLTFVGATLYSTHYKTAPKRVHA